jgi:hypothetical protein
MRLADPRAAGAVAMLLALAGCVVPPAAPTIPVLPGPGKSFASFDADQLACERYASAEVAPAILTANKWASVSTLSTTAFGAAVGGAVDAGSGAALGAASGASLGIAVNAVAAGLAQPSLQQQYDTLYASCMVSHGNRLLGSAPAGTPPVGAADHRPASKARPKGPAVGTLAS